MRTTSRLVAEDAARMAAKRGNQPGATPTAVMPTRRDNILAARTDGTFEAKRLAYNQAGQATGHSMDEAGNITAPAPTAVKPGGRLIPGHSPGSSIWQPDTPASQSGQPSQSSPSVLPPALKRPAAPRPTGLIDGQPAATTLAALKTAQTQVPRQTARNAEAPPALQLPTVASAITPPVTSNVTRNVTSPVTPPSPSLPGGMMGAVAQAAQGMQTAMTSTNPLAVLPRAAAINQTLQQRNTQPISAPPAPVPIASAPGTPGQAPSTPAYMPPMKTVPGQGTPLKPAVPASVSVAAVPQTPPLQPKRAMVPGQSSRAAMPDQVITPKTLATRPTAQRSQLALGR